jgi:1-phosphofructokinase
VTDRPSVCVFSPAPLLTITVERTLDGRDELHLHPGGQGFWVARMAQALGGDVVLCGPFGGETGGVLRHLLEDAGIRIRAIDMPSANGAYVHDRRDGERRELWEAELDVLGRHELDELYTTTLAEGIGAGVCVLTGTHLQEIVEADTYRRLASDLAANGTRVVADLSGPLLASALEGRLHVLKLSHEELLADGWAASGSVEAIRDGIGKLHDAGAANIVVSRADEGSVALLDDRWYEVRAPSMEVVDHRGAGDSMTAALAVATARDLDANETLCLAAAAGAVNVTRHGLGSGRADAIAQLAENVAVTSLAS